MSFDQRRKLSPQDYQRIQFYYTQGSTIREIANDYGISTKYVKKVLVRKDQGKQIEISWDYSSQCSGCGRHFDVSGLVAHFSTWTSGGLRELACATVMPIH